MIKDGEALKPNFWRAPVDNDYGANLQRKYIAWKNPEIKLTSFKQRTENNQVIVESAYDMPGVSAKLNLVLCHQQCRCRQGDPEADCRQECQSIEHVPFRSADAYAAQL